MAKLTSRQLTSDDKAQWQSLWERSGRHLVQHWNWADCAATGVGSPARIGVFDGGGELRAACAFVDRPRKFGRMWANPAPAPWAGVLHGETKLEEEWLRDALSLIADAVPADVDFAETVLQPGMMDGRGLAWAGWNLQIHYTYQSVITPSTEVLSAAAPNLRRRWKKARDGGVEVEQGAIELADLVTLYDKMAAEKKVPGHVGGECWLMLENWLASEESGELGMQTYSAGASKGGPPAFAAMVAWDCGTAYYLLGASDSDAHGNEAPTAVHLHIFDDLTRLKAAEAFDWCGANTPSIVQFKKQFRPTLVPLVHAVRYSRKGLVADATRRFLGR